MENLKYLSQPLLFRSRIETGESLHSLLMRLSVLNDYDVPDTLFQILQEGVGKQNALKDKTALPRRIEMYKRLEALTYVTTRDLYAASAHRFATLLTPPDISIDLLGISESISLPLLAWSLAAKQLRPASAGQFCPLCLQSAAYHRLIWLPVAVSACLEHSCLLIDRCQRCEKKVSIREILEMQCRKCKGILAESEALPLGDDAGLAVQHVIQSWFLSSTTPDAAPLLPEAQPRILYRVLDGLQWTIRMLAWTEWPHLHHINGDSHLAILQPDKGQNKITPYESYHLYTTAFKGIMNWPGGFYEFLHAYRIQLQSGRPLNGGPKADLGNLYTQWLQDYWQHPAFEFVHKAFEHYFIAVYSLSSAIARTNLCQGNPSLSKQLVGVSIAEASRLLGTTPKMIDTLLKTDRLTIQISSSAGKRIQRFVRREEVLELSKQWNEAVSLTEAAVWLGISKTIVVDLVKIGLLIAERNPREGYPHWAFSKSALADCKEKVLKRVKKCPSHKTGEKTAVLDLTGAARLLFVVGLNAVSILSCVAEGKLQAYYSADCELKLASLLFDRSDLQQCIRSIKSENSWMSREEIVKLLRVKDVTLARWVKFGLISPAAIYGGAQYFDRKTVDKFIADHVTTEEAIEILGVGKLTLQKWARQGKLSGACISGPNIDGHHGYIFNRKELVHCYEDNLRLRKQ